MKKVLFIDRDGTLVIEPPVDLQLDSFEKLEYYPYVFQNLSKIVKELDYTLVMVTNQDGLGTNSFPEESFWPVHNKIIEAFKNEGVVFEEVLIDKSFPEENSPNRKPQTGMLTHYLKGNYDLKNSFVIGDRITDIELAQNIGCQSILLNDLVSENASLVTSSWETIYLFLKKQDRVTTVKRVTNETKINVRLNLDGRGSASIQTGLGFFDHMLEQIAKHGNIDLSIYVNGDLNVDEHHTI